MQKVNQNETFRGALERANEKYKDTPIPFAMSGMTMTGYMSSRRTTMFTGNLSQFKNVIGAEIPLCFTNMENIVGRYSSGYKKLNEEMEVFEIIKRFSDESIPDQYNDYKLILYDKVGDKYHMVNRTTVKKLTENHGYRYDTTTMDSLKKNDIVEKDTVLYKSTSYDKDMNYCYGVNVTAMHALDSYVAEDGVVISKTLSELKSIEVLDPIVSINDNDLLINIYGEDMEDYKPFPDIGEEVKDSVLLARKRIHNDRVLFDFKKSELMNVSFLNNKILYGDGKVIDIEIFSNTKIEDLPDVPYLKQVKKYLYMQREYYTTLKDVLGYIIHESGSSYDMDIAYYYKRACSYLDDNFRFKDKDGNVFSYFKIKFTLERERKIFAGQKMVGRWGNKGVVSEIREDEDMPVLSNGVRIDLLLNSESPTNRLISGPLYELSINFIGNRIGEYIYKEKLSLKEKEDIFFDILGILNKKESEFFKEKYDSLPSDEQKELFFYSVYKNGMYVEVPILWEEDDNTLYDKLDTIYKKYSNILTPYDVYVMKHGVLHKMMGPHTGYVGSMYMMILKHSAFKDYASRSMGSINSRELPAKTDSAKKHRDLYPRTPIKFGYQETVNLLVAINSRIYSEINLLYRSSVQGRRDLGAKLMANEKPIEKMDYIERYVNRNVEMLNVYMKAMGLKLTFYDTIKRIKVHDDKVKSFTTPSGKLFIGTTDEYINRAIRDRLEEKYREDEALIMKTTDREKYILNEINIMRNILEGNHYLEEEEIEKEDK